MWRDSDVRACFVLAMLGEVGSVKGACVEACRGLFRAGRGRERRTDLAARRAAVWRDMAEMLSACLL